MDKHYTRFCDLVAVSSLVGCSVSGRVCRIFTAGPGGSAPASGAGDGLYSQTPGQQHVSGKAFGRCGDESVPLRLLSGQKPVPVYRTPDSGIYGQNQRTGEGTYGFVRESSADIL